MPQLDVILEGKTAAQLTALATELGVDESKVVKVLLVLMASLSTGGRKSVIAMVEKATPEEMADFGQKVSDVILRTRWLINQSRGIAARAEEPDGPRPGKI